MTQEKNKREDIITELKKQGLRITSQRKLLLDVILENECSCCKEIYYQAVKKDPGIGAATVYRMVKTLEEIGIISRKNLYRIACDEVCGLQNGCVLILKNKEQISLSAEDFGEAMELILKKKGYEEESRVDSILIKEYA